MRRVSDSQYRSRWVPVTLNIVDTGSRRLRSLVIRRVDNSPQRQYVESATQYRRGVDILSANHRGGKYQNSTLFRRDFYIICINSFFYFFLFIVFWTTIKHLLNILYLVFEKSHFRILLPWYNKCRFLATKMENNIMYRFKYRYIVFDDVEDIFLDPFFAS